MPNWIAVFHLRICDFICTDFLVQSAADFFCLVLLKCLLSTCSNIFSAFSLLQFCSLLYVELSPVAVNKVLTSLPFPDATSHCWSNFLTWSFWLFPDFDTLGWGRNCGYAKIFRESEVPFSYFSFSAHEFTANDHILTLASYFNLCRSYLLYHSVKHYCSWFQAISSLVQDWDFLLFLM